MVKLFSLLFAGIGLFIFFRGQTGSDFSNIITPVSFMVILALIYIIWSSAVVRKLNEKRIKISQVVENFIFVLVFFVVVLLSGGHESKNKFLFLFIIIVSTIQMGMRFGILTASISSALLLGLDLACAPNLAVNTYFESDLIIVAIFILTAWLIGHYVNIEKEYFERVENLAHTDELTGLYNHRYFYDKLRLSIEQSSERRPLSMIFMDIDNFKYYNDLYGHQRGDEVLASIGMILKENVVKGNILARYAGDEFAILLPDTREDEATIVAENIRNQIENTYFDGEENIPDGNLTISVGISVYPEKASSEETLIRSADDALYRAKFFNKNRVETYASTIDALKKDIEEKHIDLITSMKTLITIINSKDRYTFGHVERVVIYAKLIADQLKLSEEDKKTLIYGAYMHDLGKINIPEEVLNKQMPLTIEEWEMIKAHPYNGVKIVEPVDSIDYVIPLIMSHHERYDGNGYPDSLVGEDIPYLARVLTVIDAFDTMTFKRAYTDKKTYKQAIQELIDCSGTQFDSIIVKEFIVVIEKNIDNLALL